MFLQVFQGEVADAVAVRNEVERWHTELGPGADGWLGSTSGVTDDGVFIGLARFVSIEAAQRNSRRPDQDAWWRRMSNLFAGRVSFSDYLDVELFMDGGSDDAGFVQVMQGRAEDPARLRAVEKDLVRYIPDTRPDVIGGLMGMRDDGAFTEAVYFTSEELARAGERSEPDPEVAELIQASREMTGELTYLDLPRPWLFCTLGRRPRRQRVQPPGAAAGFGQRRKGGASARKSSIRIRCEGCTSSPSISASSKNPTAVDSSLTAIAPPRTLQAQQMLNCWSTRVAAAAGNAAASGVPAPGPAASRSSG